MLLFILGELPQFKGLINYCTKKRHTGTVDILKQQQLALSYRGYLKSACCPHIWMWARPREKEESYDTHFKAENYKPYPRNDHA